MKSSRLLAASGAALAVAAAVPALASKPAPSLVSYASAVPSWVASAPVVKDVLGSEQVQLAFALGYRDPSGLKTFIADVSNPKNANFRHFLSNEQFNARFGADPAAVSTVTTWLSSVGLVVEGATASGAVLTAHGPAALVQSALHTTLRNLRLDGQLVRAPITAPQLPARIARLVKAISGLDTVRYVPRHTVDQPARHMGPRAGAPLAFLNARPCSTYWHQTKAQGQPKYHGEQLYINTCGYTPAQVRGAYGFKSVKETGVGASVAIIDAYASPTIEQDLATYSAKHGLPQMKSGQFTQMLPQPVEQNFPEAVVFDPEGWSGEETLDVEAVHSFAPGANIIYVPAASDLNLTINLAIMQTVEASQADVVSNSYGSAGESVAPDDKTLFDLAMSQAAAKGMTFVFSSGDAGDDLESTGKRQVDYPASSDMVLALGATSLYVGKGNTYQGEGYWGTRKYLRGGDGWDLGKSITYAAGGGGVSTLYPEPSWQKAVVPNELATYGGVAPGRVVPDISIVGDSTTGFLIGQTQTQAGGQASYSEYRIGGTSLSCPLLAGMLASAIERGGKRLGLVQPVIYAGAGSSAFRDGVKPAKQVAVVRYDYKTPSDPSTALVPSLRVLGDLSTLHLTKGFDDATGIGTPVAGPFIRLLAGH